MILHVEEAKYSGNYSIWVRFNDGLEGEVDLSNALDGEMFEPLRDIDKFKSFKIDPIMETIIWDNGADIAPEYLYEILKIK